MRIQPIVLGLAAALIAVPGLAGPVSAARRLSIPPTRAALADCGGAPTAEALADFFDQSIPDSLAKNKVPGAVVSVVSGDRSRSPRDTGWPMWRTTYRSIPDRSLVRIASITKLFTWTAVMQQVQAGRLDLNADVNRYLTAFKIPATYPQPITAAEPDGPHRRLRGPGHRHRRPDGRRRHAAGTVPGRHTCRPGSARPARSRPTPTTAPRWPATSWPRSAGSPTTSTSSSTCSARWR